MADYLDITTTLFEDVQLKAKVQAATIKAATGLMAGTPTAGEQKWCAAAIQNPGVESQKAFRSLLANNDGFTVQQIKDSPDSTIQTEIDALVPSLVAAFNA